MSRRLFSVFCLLFAILSKAQNFETLIPPTPTAASIGKNIEVPVSLNTGVPSVKIPIWELREGQVSVPIDISYNTSGIKVEEIASWIGTGWNLNFGGGIFRTARGLADDVDGGFLRTSGDRTVDGFDLVTDINQRNELIRLSLDGTLDYQPDIFSFSILGYQGKFFFDQNSKEILMFSKSDVKIEPIYEVPSQHKNILEWRVTLPNGVQCYFGEANAYDSSNGFTFDPASKSSINKPQGARNAWYISRVVDFTGKSINYDYESIIKNVSSFVAQGESFIPSNTMCNVNLLTPDYSIYYSGISVSARIKQIQSSESKIVFIVEDTPRADNSEDKALKQIEVYQNGENRSNLITTFDFSYQYTYNSTGEKQYPQPCINPPSGELSTRLFLASLTQTKENKSLPSYTFYYNELLLPARSSFAQDYWGYYNGANDNSKLIPEVYIPNYWNPNGNSLNLKGANRKVNENFAQAGILKKIKYPTGGTTEFSYESNRASISKFDFTDFEATNVIVEKIVSLSDRDLEMGNPGTYFVEKTFFVAENSCSDKLINNKIFVRSHYPCDGGRNGCQVIIKLDNKELQFDGTRKCVELAAGQHTLSYFVIHPNLGDEKPNFYAEVAREYVDNINLNVDSAGLRIKEIVHSPIIGNQIIKRYEYFEGGILNMPVYGHIRAGVFECYLGIGGAEGTDAVDVYERRSNSSTPLLYSNGGYITYGKVHEIDIGINGKRNGVSKSAFSFLEDTVNRFFPFEPSTSVEWRRGNLLKTEIFSTDVNDLETKISEVNYLYDYRDNVSQKGYFFTRTYIGNTANSDFISKSFTTLGESKILVEKLERRFFNGLTNYENKTSLYYESPLHLQATNTEVTNSKNKKLKTKNYYAHELNDVRLINEHRINLLLKKEVFEEKSISGDDKLISTQNTVYNDFNGLYLPQKTQTSKGAQLLEDRIIYHDYDNSGNPLEVSKAEGTHTTYIWGYNKTQPLAKIENSTYAQVQGQVGNLQSLSNADDDRTTDIINSNGSITYMGSEGSLRQALNNLRTSLSDAQVTSYTYDPLIGVTSVTDPRGRTVYYDYDDFNRLERIIDQEGNVVEDYDYHYQNED